MLIWRVATSGKFNDSYLSICKEWTIVNLLQALEMLDIQTALEREQVKKSHEGG